ncbi:MAG: sulfite exporter TauE/SafE family protein [Candidatus Helarchaeales archaeon]
MIVIILVLIGSIVGLVSSFFGVGACFIMVPVMIFIFQNIQGIDPSLAPLIAFGTNMAIVVPTALSGALRHRKTLHSKDHEFPTKNYLYFVIPVALGSVTGSLEAFIFFVNFRAFAGLIMKLLFGVFCLIGAYRFLRAKPLQLDELKEPVGWKYGIAGFFSGMLAHFMGIGGGLIYMPVLNTILGVPALFAVAVSLSTMVVGSLVGAVSYSIFGGIDQAMHPADYPPLTFGWFSLGAFIFIGVFSIIFAQIGPKLAHKIDPKRFKILLAIVYIYIGIRLIVNSIFQLIGLPAPIP